MKAVDPFQDSGPQVGLAPGRGGFLANSIGVRYISDPAGGTVKLDGKKADLLAIAAERGIDVPEKVTVAELHEILGGRVKRIPYSDTSNFGTLIENRGSLEKWSERNVVAGLAEGGFDRLFDEYNAADPADRHSIADKIVARAKDVANASLAADRGTHVHSITERFDRRQSFKDLIPAGIALGISEAQQVDAVTAWHKMLETNGLEVLAIEASVVDDEWRCAGTLDRLVRCTRDLPFVLSTGEIVTIPAGYVAVLDLKSGSLRRTAAIQLASYAASVPYDTATETRGEWPWLVSHHGLIAHMSIDAGTCVLHYVNLVAGREHGGQCVVMAKAWEARADLFSVAQLADDPIAADPDVVPADVQGQQLPMSVPGSAPASAAPARTPADELDAVRSRPTPDEGNPVDEYDALKARYDNLGAAGRSWIHRLAEEATHGRVPFHLSSLKTTRRFEILRALVLLAEEYDDQLDTDDFVRGLLEPIIGDCAQYPMIPVGHLLGSLSATEALQFAQLVTGDLVIAFDDRGRASLKDAA